MRYFSVLDYPQAVCKVSADLAVFSSQHMQFGCMIPQHTEENSLRFSQFFPVGMNKRFSSYFNKSQSNFTKVFIEARNKMFIEIEEQSQTMQKYSCDNQSKRVFTTFNLSINTALV